MQQGHGPGELFGDQRGAGFPGRAAEWPRRGSPVHTRPTCLAAKAI